MIRPASVFIAAILLLGPLLVAEFGMRSLVASGRLPEAPSSSEFADVSLANLQRVGQPDVLIMGMSTVRNAIKPDTLERRIESDLGRPITVQNVAQGGISLESQRIIVSQLAEQGLLPDVVITGLSPVTLASEHEGSAADWFRRSELGRLWAGCEAGSLSEEELECRLSEVSTLWRWRGHTEQVAEALGEGMPRTITDGGRTLQPSGWLSARPSDAERLGQNLPRALERLDEEIVASDQLAGSWTAFVDELRANDVEVIVLRMPYYEPLVEGLVERNPDWLAQRDAGYQRLDEASGIQSVEIEGFDEVVEAPWYRDPRHLSRMGAPEFTRLVWAEDAVREPVLKVLSSAD